VSARRFTIWNNLSNALRKVRYHAVDADRDCVPDIIRTIRRIDEHEKTRSVECIDETAGGCVVPEADV
jgi:hypothetical protein